MVFTWKKLRLQRPMKNPPYSRAAVGWPKMKEMESLAEFYNPEKLYSPHMTVSMRLTMIHGHLREVEQQMRIGWIHLQHLLFRVYEATLSVNCFLLPPVFENLGPIDEQWSRPKSIKLALLCLVWKSWVTFIQRLAYILVISWSKRQINTASFCFKLLHYCNTQKKITVYNFFPKVEVLCSSRIVSVSIGYFSV